MSHVDGHATPTVLEAWLHPCFYVDQKLSYRPLINTNQHNKRKLINHGLLCLLTMRKLVSQSQFNSLQWRHGYSIAFTSHLIRKNDMNKLWRCHPNICAITNMKLFIKRWGCHHPTGRLLRILPQLCNQMHSLFSPAHLYIWKVIWNSCMYPLFLGGKHYASLSTFSWCTCPCQWIRALV